MKILYICLLVLRVLLTLQPGYIHPDEFFQGGQEMFFGCSSPKFSHEVQLQLQLQQQATKHITLGNEYNTANGNVPIDVITATWEFEAENALRSIIPPTLMTLFPLQIFSRFRHKCRGFSLHQCITGWEILIIPRICMALLSIIMLDVPVWYIAKARREYAYNQNDRPHESESIPIEVMALASSWVTLGFLNRPFSNSLETMCLSVLCMFVVIDMKMVKARSTSKHVLYYNEMIPAMGIVGALGLFTRFTFAIFALPTVVVMLYVRMNMPIKCNSSSNIPNSGLQRGKSLFFALMLIAIPFVAVSCVFIHHDTVFYSLQSSYSEENDIAAIRIGGSAKFITPWNAFRYNSRVGNLSDHGLHPRITHALVNLPMLYGPLAIAFYLSTATATAMAMAMKRRRKEHNVKVNTNYIDGMLYGIIIVGLGVLSCAPHQEPRFLLPLLIPLVLLYGDAMEKHARFGHCIAYFWIAFNALLLIFFGGIHQAAVIPSIAALPYVNVNVAADGGRLPKAIIYYHTYMPPTFLLRNEPLSETNSYDCTDEPGVCTNTDVSRTLPLCLNVPIIDLQGSDETNLVSSVQHHLSCANSDSNFVYIVSPRSVMKGTRICGNHVGFTCGEIWNSFQIATEDLPVGATLQSFVEDSKLGMFEIKCAGE